MSVALLLLFAVLAGAGTAISPCVLPILPALLSAGATGGRRRPLGIVLGLAITFTITIVGLAEVVDGVGLGDGTLRTVAVDRAARLRRSLLLVPRLADRVEAALSPLIALGPRTRGHGFCQRAACVGAALGFVYAPCAGPILAAVISVSAASGRPSPWRSPTRPGRRPCCWCSASAAGAWSSGSARPGAARGSSARWAS